MSMDFDEQVEITAFECTSRFQAKRLGLQILQQDIAKFKSDDNQIFALNPCERCPYTYRSPSCTYHGEPIGEDDVCNKTPEDCKARFGDEWVIKFGGWLGKPDWTKQ